MAGATNLTPILNLYSHDAPATVKEPNHSLRLHMKTGILNRSGPEPAGLIFSAQVSPVTNRLLYVTQQHRG